MSAFPSWYAKGTHAAPAFPTGWDAANLGGIVLAGRALVTSGELVLKIDPRKKKGSNASHMTSHGLDASEFGLRVCVWTVEQMEAVDDALPLLCPPLNLEPVSFDHPQVRSLIRLLGKLDVVVKGCSIWQPSSVVSRGWEMHIKLIHWASAMRNAKGQSHTPTRPANVLVGDGSELQSVDPTELQSSNPLPTDNQSLFDPPISSRG